MNHLGKHDCQNNLITRSISSCPLERLIYRLYGLIVSHSLPSFSNEIHSFLTELLMFRFLFFIWAFEGLIVLNKVKTFKNSEHVHFHDSFICLGRLRNMIKNSNVQLLIDLEVRLFCKLLFSRRRINLQSQWKHDVFIGCVKVILSILYGLKCILRLNLTKQT